jgi:hypothetical protein
MRFDWQTAAVVLIVLAATLYVGRMAWARVRSMRGRGTVSLPACAGCDAGEAKKRDTPTPKVLVQIGRAQSAKRH